MNKTYNQLPIVDQEIIDDYISRYMQDTDLHKTKSDAIRSYNGFDENRHVCVREPMHTFFIEVNGKIYTDPKNNSAMFAGYEWPDCVHPFELSWDMWRII